MSLEIQERSANALSYVRPITVAYVRAEGPIDTAASEAWGKLRSAIARMGACEFSAGYGLVHGPLSKTAQMSFDACIELPADCDGLYAGRLATQMIAGGVHIAGAAVGNHHSLSCALDELFNDPLIGHGLSIADDRPAIVTYAHVTTMKRSLAWSLTLNLPLCWGHGKQVRAA